MPIRHFYTIDIYTQWLYGNTRCVCRELGNSDELSAGSLGQLESDGDEREGEPQTRPAHQNEKQAQLVLRLERHILRRKKQTPHIISDLKWLLDKRQSKINVCFDGRILNRAQQMRVRGTLPCLAHCQSELF